MKSSRSVWWVLAGLWVVAGGRWLTDQAWPVSASSLTSQARACAVGAVLAVGWTAVRKTEDPMWRKVIALACAGAVLFAGQVVGAVLHGVAGDEYDRAAALCLVPVVVTVARQVVGPDGMADLWPGLAGLAGALLIFPLTTGGSVLGYVGLVLPVLLVGVACVVAEREARGLACAWAMAALLGGGAAGLGFVHWAFLRGNVMESAQPIWQPLVFDLPLVGLTALALLVAGGRRFSASYFAVPFLTVAGGAAVLRPGWTWRLVGGLLLLVAGTVGLVRRTEADTPGLGLAG